MTHIALNITNVCAAAPTGVQSYVDMILSWIKYGVICAIIGWAFFGVGMIVAGKKGQMAQVSTSGVHQLAYAIGAAIAYVTIYAIIMAIVNGGSCG